MRNYRVERRFGWDTHGLPVEYEVEQDLKLNGAQEIRDYGVARYNEACRSIVLRYTAEWRETVERMARWVDFDNDYKTMDRDFMESVWWVFKQLWDKGLIYEGHKVLPYSWACQTVVSNRRSSGYKQRALPSEPFSLAEIYKLVRKKYHSKLFTKLFSFSAYLFIEIK